MALDMSSQSPCSSGAKKPHLRRLLTTTNHHVVEDGRDVGGVHGPVRLIGLQRLQRLQGA